MAGAHPQCGGHFAFLVLVSMLAVVHCEYDELDLSTVFPCTGAADPEAG